MEMGLYTAEGAAEESYIGAVGTLPTYAYHRIVGESDQRHGITGS